MKKLRAAILAVTLAVALAFAAAPLAHAAPPRLPDSGDCTIVVTYDWSGVTSEHPSGNLRSQTAIQDLKSSDGTYCSSRALFKYWTTTGTETLNHRIAQMFNGSSFFGAGESFATVTVGTGGGTYAGPWVDPCTNFLAFGEGFRNVAGNFVQSQTGTYEYRC